MAKLHIPISGAQGGGKTSLLAELKKRGYHVDDFKVSRAVQFKLGWASLEHVMESPQTMMAFQEQVFNEKLQNDRTLHLSSNTVTFTERSFADIVAYTCTWMWRFVDRGDIELDEAIAWLAEYTKGCTAAQTEIYDGVILLPMMGHVVFQEDPHRAKKEDIRPVYETLERFMEMPAFINFPKLVVTAKTIEERADQVETWIRGLA